MGKHRPHSVNSYRHHLISVARSGIIVTVAVYPREVSFALQPLYSLHTGGAVAVEAFARPAAGTARQLLGRARKDGKLVQTDVSLAAQAIDCEAEHQTLLPLHVNLLTVSAAAPAESLKPILDALSRAGRRAREVVVEIGPPYTYVEPVRLLEGIDRLRDIGFLVALDGLGVGDLPLGLLAAANFDLLKIDRSMVRMLPSSSKAVAVVEALLHVSSRTDSRLVATGIETDEQFTAARELGVRFVQGNLFASANGNLPMATLLPAATKLPGPQEPSALSHFGVPTVAEFIRPPATLPADVTCDEARVALAADDQPTAMVGLDPAGRPRWTIDRSRFLLAISGRYGHALHASKPAERFADAPHTIPANAGALELLELVADSDSGRMNDDIVVIDRAGVCLGIVRVAEVIRGVAEAKIEEAASLHPLSGLPSSDTIAKDVDRRIAADEPFVAAWLDIDQFKSVNDQVGFAAGDDLIRSLGRTLTELASSLPKMTVSHVGGDDFLIACDMDEIGVLAPALLDTPWTAEGVTVSVSLAGLVCGPGTVGSYREVSQQLPRLKQRAKSIRGSNWVLGRPGVDRVDVLRGRLAQGVA